MEEMSGSLKAHLTSPQQNFVYCGNIYFVNDNEKCNKKRLQNDTWVHVTWSLRNPKLYILAQNCLSTSNWKSASGFTSYSLNYLSLFVQLLIACWFWAESSIFTPMMPPKKHCNHSYSLDCKFLLWQMSNYLLCSCQ